VSPDRIRIDSFLLADGVKVCDGKLYIHGGGWNFLNVMDPKAARPISLAGRVIVPWETVERELKLVIGLEHVEAGTVLERVPIIQIVMQAQSRPDHPESLETATPFVVDIPGIGFFHPGEYAFVISHEGEELARTRFQVNFVETDAPVAEGTEATPPASR